MNKTIECILYFKRIAVEAIVLSASKKDKATGILSAGSEVLKDLYQSSNEDIKVLALVVSITIQPIE